MIPLIIKLKIGSLRFKRQNSGHLWAEGKMTEKGDEEDILKIRFIPFMCVLSVCVLCIMCVLCDHRSQKWIP